MVHHTHHIVAAPQVVVNMNVGLLYDLNGFEQKQIIF